MKGGRGNEGMRGEGREGRGREGKGKRRGREEEGYINSIYMYQTNTLYTLQCTFESD